MLERRDDAGGPVSVGQKKFDECVLPHLGAAYNLARWLTRNDHDAEDVVQESFLRAYKFFGGFRGGDGRPWLLAIVRNTCMSWIQRNRPRELAASLDDSPNGVESDAPTPEAELIRAAENERIIKTVEELPLEFREVVVLREMEGMSYKEIADVTGIPLGTVMSRLARARKRLQLSLAAIVSKGA